MPLTLEAVSAPRYSIFPAVGVGKLATPFYVGGDLLAFILAFAVEFQTYSVVRKLATIWNGLKALALEDFQRQQMKTDA